MTTPDDRERAEAFIMAASVVGEVSVELVEDLIAEVRAEALEQAARECDAEGRRLRSVSHYEDRAQTAWECARRIRVLKEKT